jgi:hypothetical protein
MTELFGAAEQAENCSRHGATSGPEPTSDVALEGVS